MHVVILHYHLNRGGVTRVIEKHLEMLAHTSCPVQPQRVTIAHGGRANDWRPPTTTPFPVSLVTIPDLEYDALAIREETRSPLSAVIHDKLLTSSDPQQTVLHVHNHSLGKTAELPKALLELARQGWRLVLQPHDFAEDLRPDNYRHMLAGYDSLHALQESLYPQAPHIHYAVLNGRDFTMLKEAGVATANVHLLPNAAIGRADHADKAQSEARKKVTETFGVAASGPFVLYPVRGIRRKNLGELLLWAALQPSATFAVTLSPLNPVERRSYEAWREIAQALNLRVVFDIGEGELSLDENYAAADAVISTSVAEGFGLVFLEAWMRGRRLLGRRIPGIVDDFENAGLVLDGLSNRFDVPQDQVDHARLSKVYYEQSLALREAYGMTPAPAAQLETEIEACLAGDCFDFGRLDATGQIDLLRKVCGDKSLRDEILQLNPTVATAFSLTEPSAYREIVRGNQHIINAAFSAETIGIRLGELYQCVLAAGAEKVNCSDVVGKSILQQFVQPRSLFPIRLNQ